MAARLFFALWPEREAATALWDMTRQSLALARGRVIPAEEFHITLVFLGTTSAEYQARFEQAAGAVSALPLTLTLNCLGHWPRPRVLWAGATEVPAELNALVRDLQGSLVTCGFEAESCPYVPHVTLLRGCRRAPETLSIPAVDWHFREFCLVESLSGEGARYRIRRRWPLRA